MLFPPVAKTFVVVLTMTNAISKNLLSSGTEWLPVVTCIHLLLALDAVVLNVLGVGLFENAAQSGW